VLFINAGVGEFEGYVEVRGAQVTSRIWYVGDLPSLACGVSG
jgi:hypothetical protein